MGLLTWKSIKEIAVVAPSIPVNPVLAPAGVKSGQKPPRNPEAEKVRPLQIEVPIVGNLHGVAWFKLNYSDPEGRMPSVDVLTNEQGLALMARHGEEAYATLPNQKACQEFLPKYFIPYSGYSALKYVRICPLPVDDPSFRQVILSNFVSSPLFRLQTFIPLEFEFEKDPNGRRVRRGVLKITNCTTIGEADLHVTYGDIFNPERKSYEPPVVAGANRFGTLVFLGFTEIPLPGEIDPNLNHSGKPVSIHEPWARGTPWRDEQLDPIYGDYRIDELSIPSDSLVLASEDLYGVWPTEKELILKLRPEAEARRAARLAQEAAGKGK